MSHGDDDDGGDEDAQLRSMRAVWLSMPDEDPPERGLDALMAAARSKASEMSTSASAPAEGSREMPAAPSWWDRFVAAFRRPPVLAFATVVILIAGAAVIGGRQMSATAPDGVPTQSTPPSEEDIPTQRREQESLKQEAPPPQATEDRAVAPVPPREPAVGTVEAGKEAKSEAADAITTTGAASEGKWQAVTDEKVREEKERDKLLDAAKTAAARGDCAGARNVARQLQQQDLGYYRSRVVPEPGLAECLHERKTGTTTDRATTAEPVE